jgi:hypothetical protein
MNNLTFDELYDLIEENQIEKETDKRIAKKILEAERDWRTSFETVNEFISVLEKAVNGTVTKSSLNKLLKRYKQNILQNAWEMESVSYLLDIFELTNETELRKIIINLTAKVKTE